MTCMGIFPCKLAIFPERDTQNTMEAKMITKILPGRNKNCNFWPELLGKTDYSGSGNVFFVILSGCLSVDLFCGYACGGTKRGQRQTDGRTDGQTDRQTALMKDVANHGQSSGT